MKNLLRISGNLFPYFCLFLLSLFPVLYTWGKLKIGGDVMIPFDLSPLKKYLFQWLAVQNGEYYVHNYLPLYLLYTLANYLHLSIYQISSLIYFLINFFAALGIYKLTRLLSPKEGSIVIRLIPVCFYLFSPALLNGWQYLYFYGVLPWYLYLIFKFVLKNKVGYLDLVWLHIAIFFGSLDLPNPKYLFYLLIVPIVIISVAKLIGAFKFSQINHLLSKTLLFGGLCFYLLLPLGYFVVHYQPNDYGVRIKSGYVDSGAMMDYGVSTARQMVTLHHGANYNDPVQVSYLKNPIVILTGYIVILTLLVGMIRHNSSSKYAKPKLYLSALIIVFLFLSIGPNPPFGFIYEYMVTNIKLFAFLRTTAGAVFFLSLFYSLYLYLHVLEVEHGQWKFVIASYIIVLIVGYPIILGHIYKNSSIGNKLVDAKERGITLPNEYLSVADQLNNKRLDQKTYYPDADPSYLHTDWGYFGPPLYYFLYDNYPIFKNRVYGSLEDHNIGLAFIDGSIATESSFVASSSSTKIAESGKINVFALSKNNFKPHFQVSGSSKTSKPTLEYKRIDPTKYRLNIHGLSGDFEIIFSERFNTNWLIYPGTSLNSKDIILKDWHDKYKILESNELDQATSQELSQFIDNGLVSTLGSGKPKQTTHYRWVDGLKIADSIEKYSVDFISKNFQNTIQNDNLPRGILTETWFVSPIRSLDHQETNGYANKWKGSVANLCRANVKCLENQDGSVDVELVVEFMPQKIFYLSILVTAISFTICLALWIVSQFEKRHD